MGPWTLTLPQGGPIGSFDPAHLGRVPGQMDVLAPREVHRPGHPVVAGHGVDLLEHLLADPAVAGMTLGRGAQLDHVERLAGVELDHVADPVGQGDQVLGLLGEVGRISAQAASARSTAWRQRPSSPAATTSDGTA